VVLVFFDEMIRISTSVITFLLFIFWVCCYLALFDQRTERDDANSLLGVMFWSLKTCLSPGMKISKSRKIYVLILWRSAPDMIAGAISVWLSLAPVWKHCAIGKGVLGKWGKFIVTDAVPFTSLYPSSCTVKPLMNNNKHIINNIN